MTGGVGGGGNILSLLLEEAVVPSAPCGASPVKKNKQKYYTLVTFF